MAPDTRTPFDSIEGAHEYVRLLEDTIGETLTAIEADIVTATETAGAQRRLDALRLVNYKLTQLHGHFVESSRLLNDLRTLRRLLLGRDGDAH
jgi:hypothetical protein